VARRWFSQELKGLIEAKLVGQQAVVSAPAPTTLPLPEALKKSFGTQNESKRGTTEDGRTAFSRNSPLVA